MSFKMGQISEPPGADPAGGGGGGPGGQDPIPHLPFLGGPPNFIKREKASRMCAQIRCILVLNSFKIHQGPSQHLTPHCQLGSIE